MLAKGKGAISIDEFRKLFNLPEDAEVINVKIEGNEIIFEMLSAEAVKGKFIVDEYGYGNIRRFRLKANLEINTEKRDAKDITEEILKGIKGKGV